jgi:hypothetical protein
MSEARHEVSLAMLQAEQAVLQAVAPLLAPHGVQAVIGAMSVVAGGLIAVAHAQGLLQGSVATNTDHAAELLRCGLHERVRKMLVEGAA